MQSRVDVGGMALFIENTAVDGAGLALEDQCLVININNIYNFLSKHNSANLAYINILYIHRFIFSGILSFTSTGIQQK